MNKYIVILLSVFIGVVVGSISHFLIFKEPITISYIIGLTISMLFSTFLVLYFSKNK